MMKKSSSPFGESGLSRNSLSENTLMPFSSFNCGF